MTEQGEILLSYAEQVMQLMMEAEIKINQSLLAQEPVLSVYVSHYLSEHYFADIVSLFRTSCPDQPIEMHPYGYEELEKRLLEGTADLAFLSLYEDWQLQASFEFHHLYEEEMLLIVPAGHIWKNKRNLSLEDLSLETILLPNNTFSNQNIVGELLRRFVNIRYLHMNNFEMIKQSVKAGLGIAFLPREAVHSELERGELATVSISSLQLKRSIGFVSRKDKPMSQPELSFCEAVQAYFQSKTLSAVAQ